MPKKHVRKQLPKKISHERKSRFSEKQKRHYAFGFLVGEY